MGRENRAKQERRAGLATGAIIIEALSAIVREMRRSMVRSSYSSIIYEGYDFSCVLLDGAGRLVAESGEDHPFHLIPVAGAVEGAARLHGTIAADEILLHNDPYSGGTHLNDVAVIWPVTISGARLFHIVVRSHWGDVGGMTPGSLNGAATEIIQEGLRLDYLRLPRNGTSELLRMIFDNVRATREAVADFDTVLGICRVAERRLADCVRKYGADTIAAGIEDALDGAERRLRSAIAELPAGVYRHTAYLDGNAATPHPLTVKVALTIEGDGLHADFTGSSQQVPAPLNAGPAIAPTSVLTVVKSFLDPRGAINSGTLRAIRVTAPEGTIVHAKRPAPCGGLNEVRFACDAAIMGALGQVIPERMTGDVRGTSNHTYIGSSDFIFYEYPSGGTGGFSGGDGNAAVRAFNEGENVSIQSAEVVEAIYPLRIRRNEIRVDSGGAGRFRGGCGLVREIEVLGRDARLSVLSDRNIIPPAGVNGGLSGAANRYRVRRDGATIEPSAFPGKVANFPLRSGDIVAVESSGGGGYGDPLKRDPAALASDLADGYVTEAGRARYEASPLVLDARADSSLAGNAVRLSPATAARLGAKEGDLVELLRELGPSIRLWVVDTRAAAVPDAIIVPAVSGLAGCVRVQLLSDPGRRDD
ncbi:MAG: hydantoinase B/oxoprolinase family protein [Hyphomicrobiaceae bacterium]